MTYLKTTWNKEKKIDVPINVMEHIAARGSFVVVKSKDLFREIASEKKIVEDNDGSYENMSISDKLNYKIKEVNFSLWMGNIGDNFTVIRKNQGISKIKKTQRDTVIIVGAGPSIKEKNHIELLKTKNDKLIDIISTDRMFIPLLKEGIHPDIVVSADGHRKYIAPFYESELIISKLKTIAAFSISVAPNVVSLFPGSIYFFTPMVDNIDLPFSVSSALSLVTKTPVLSTGGNVGVTSIFLAFYLGYKNIILTGMDMGYTYDTPVEKSQYYSTFKEADPTLTPEKYKNLYIIEGYNPDFKMKYYTDITWKLHIDHFIQKTKYMAEHGATIINATEGGSLHGGAIKSMSLKEAIRTYG